MQAYGLVLNGTILREGNMMAVIMALNIFNAGKYQNIIHHIRFYFVSEARYCCYVSLNGKEVH